VWPQPLARLDPDSRALAMALSISIVLHAIVLSIHFKLPRRPAQAHPVTARVVLVNSKKPARSRSGPRSTPSPTLTGAAIPISIAGRKSPLPVTQPTERGSDLKEAMRRVQELEARQDNCSRKRSPGKRCLGRAEPQAEMRSQVSGADLAEAPLIVAR